VVHADPIDSDRIPVIDGDTIHVAEHHGRRAPRRLQRAGKDARTMPAERALGETADCRLRKIVAAAINEDSAVASRAVVSAAGLGLTQAKLSRNSNQIACGRIRQFESDMPSQAVLSSLDT